MKTVVNFLSAVGKPVGGTVVFKRDLVERSNLQYGSTVSIKGPGDKETTDYTIESIELRVKIPEHLGRDSIIANRILVRRVPPAPVLN